MPKRDASRAELLRNAAEDARRPACIAVEHPDARDADGQLLPRRFAEQLTSKAITTIASWIREGTTLTEVAAHLGQTPDELKAARILSPTLGAAISKAIGDRGHSPEEIRGGRCRCLGRFGAETTTTTAPTEKTVAFASNTSGTVATRS